MRRGVWGLYFDADQGMGGGVDFGQMVQRDVGALEPIAGGRMSEEGLIPLARIEQRILTLRGQRVMIDADLAELYGVPTRTLNQAVRRNQARFPDDFVFALTAEEKAQVITICDHLAKLKFSKVLPLAFTEHGAMMAGFVLNTPQASEMSVYVVRAFVRLRQLTTSNQRLAAKLAALEHKLDDHDAAIRDILDAIRQLMMPPDPPKKRQIGFVRDE